jgi:hypothetical protein
VAKPQDDTITLLEIGNEFKKIYASIWVLKLALAAQVSCTDEAKVESFLKFLEQLEKERLASDPQVRDSELAIRALRAWHTGQA